MRHYGMLTLFSNNIYSEGSPTFSHKFHAHSNIEIYYAGIYAVYRVHTPRVNASRRVVRCVVLQLDTQSTHSYNTL